MGLKEDINFSLWCDFIEREFLETRFKEIIKKKIIQGATSNPAIFESSITNSLAYKQQLDMLQRIQGLMGITRAETLVCGDGANDLSMFAHADTRVAFCAREVLKKEANIVIDTKDLTKILDYIKA